MKKYFYNYQTIIHFETPVSRHFFRLRCMPCVNACQRMRKRDLFLHPSDYLTHDIDAWGNPIQYGSRMDAHDSFIFVSSGEAILAPYCIPESSKGDVFKAQTSLTAMSHAMREFAAETATTGSPTEQATALAERIYGYMGYVPGSTFNRTTAANAFDQRQGVCQDYAHILIAMCRDRGIAARYVNGFIPGIGATHAWVEVLDNGKWMGIDPTNNQLIEYGYIKLAHGRDTMDCPVNRGVYTGTALQQVEIRVIVEEA